MTARRRYHVGLPSLLYVVITILLAVGAFNSQNNLLFLAFGLAIGAGIVSGLVSGAMMMSLRIERSAPPIATAGVPTSVRYTVTNTSRFVPAFALIVTESSPARGRPATWGRSLPALRVSVLHLAPRANVELSLAVTPIRRGEAVFDAVVVTSSFPFGLVRKSLAFHQRGVMLILPRSERLRRDAAGALISRADAGLTSTTRLGRGDEFYGLREYIPGDSPRLISWRASARSSALVVRENTMPTAGVLWVVLNLNAPPSPGEAPDDPTEQAIVLAASLIDNAMAVGVDPGLAVPGAGLFIPPSDAPRHRPALLGALARLDARSRVDPARDQDDSLARLTQRAGCIVVHAGAVDPTIGPANARHVSAADLERLTARAGPPRAETGA